MKKSLFKTSLLCASIILGISAFADPGSTVPGAGGYINPNLGGLDAGSIDNSNFIRNQQYQRSVRYAETKDPAIIEE